MTTEVKALKSNMKEMELRVKEAEQLRARAAAGAVVPASAVWTLTTRCFEKILPFTLTRYCSVCLLYL